MVFLKTCSWAQELGRAGRDGLPSQATILYCMSDTEHAGAWIKGSLSNSSYCSRVLQKFSNFWKYVMADLPCKCRRKLLLELFGEKVPHSDEVQKDCCDVCQVLLQGTHEVVDFSKELEILYDAIDIIGQKGEMKLTQWIRGLHFLGLMTTISKHHRMETHILNVGGLNSLESAM